jgi:nucleoside-diphosphate-sugar epimerase
MTQPSLIITGAAGFLGGHLIRRLSQQYRVFALDIRMPQAAPAAHVCWFQVDIGCLDSVRAAFQGIKAMGGAKILLHLAGYYDFSGADHPEYVRTNVVGTRNLLELSALLKLKKFVFTSSLAACPFPRPGEVITEDTPPTAPTPYARSKRAGEELLGAYQTRVPACIVRPAAIFSDWSEYALLTHFLSTWFSKRWNARILGGQGQWAIPYLHVHDLVSFYLRVVEKSETLQPLEVLQASPNGCTTLLTIYREATRCYYGSARLPLNVPKPLARLGLRLREKWGRVTGHMPFERAWMAQYLDLQLNIDASRTYQRLDWTPTPDLSLLKRLPVLVHHLVHQPQEWKSRQEQWRQAQPLQPKQRHSVSSQ